MGPKKEVAWERVEQLKKEGIDAIVVTQREDAIKKSDIVSSATFSSQPLVEGKWLKPGCHLDLVGSFTPESREADDDCILGSTVFVDSFSALKESGYLAIPIKKSDLFLVMAGFTVVSFIWVGYIIYAFPEESNWLFESLLTPINGESIHKGSLFFYLNKIRIVFGELIYLPLFLLFRDFIKNNQRSNLLLITIWICLPIVLLSLSSAKRATYLMVQSAL